MNQYDPQRAPDPEMWLTLDEQERIQLVEDYHRRQKVKLPSLKAHAAFHAIVENQLAEGLESVQRAMVRLAKQGLSRHDSVHAVAWVLSQQFYELMNAKTADPTEVVQARYATEVERLNADAWLAQDEE